MSDRPRVAVLGGGQLARMLVLAGAPLGLRFRIVDPQPDACAGELAELVVAPFDDGEALASRLGDCAAVTFDFENVPAATASRIAAERPVRPPPQALAAAQDRLEEKRLFRRLGFATAAFAPVDGEEDLAPAIAAVGLPAVLKTRRLGYDGKGQVRIARLEDAPAAWRRLGGRPAILEAFVPFERELSVLAVRGADGELRCYPPVRNWHREGVLAASLAPAPIPPALARRAVAMAERLAAELGYVGVLALELFEREGELLANEFAPRVHNSGHWSIEGAETSQFENHLRAVLGWPLGATGARGVALMLNFVGGLPAREPLLALPGLHWHEYGKAPRAGRKLGHATLVAADAAQLAARLEALAAALPLAGLEREIALALAGVSR